MMHLPTQNSALRKRRLTRTEPALPVACSSRAAAKKSSVSGTLFCVAYIPWKCSIKREEKIGQADGRARQRNCGVFQKLATTIYLLPARDVANERSLASDDTTSLKGCSVATTTDTAQPANGNPVAP